MNKSILSCILILTSLPIYSGELLNIKDIHQYQRLHSQYAGEGNWSKAAETDAELRQLIPKSIPNILAGLSDLSPHQQTSLIVYLRKLSDEDYIKVVTQLIKHADLKSPLQGQFIERIIFEPFEGQRDNLFSMNWRDQHIRDICLILQKKLSPESLYQKKLSSILDGRDFKNMIYNALEHGELRIPYRLGREGYAPQFKKWGEKEDIQIAAIKELGQTWHKALSVFVAMRGPEDIPQVNQAWKNAADKAKIVMEMLPPDTEEAQHRVGKFFYDTIFSQYSALSPLADVPDSAYQKMLKKLVQIYETNEKNLFQLKAFEQFQREMNNYDSYLNEEAIYLCTEDMRKKNRNKRISRGQ